MGLGAATKKVQNKSGHGYWDWAPHGKIARSVEFTRHSWSGLEEIESDWTVGFRRGPTFEELERRINAFLGLTTEGSPNQTAIANSLVALMYSEQEGVLPRSANPTGDEGIVLEYFFDGDVYGFDFYNSGEIVYFEKRKGCRTTGREVLLAELKSLIQSLSRYAQARVR